MNIISQPYAWRIILTLFQCLHFLFLLAQSDTKEKQFHNYTVSDGLPSMEIYDVLQDQQGYIWLGTEAGLCKYDGYQFYTYTTKDGLPNNDVIDIEEDNEGRIWINSLGPLAYFQQDSFVKYEIDLRYIYSGTKLVPNGLGEYWMNYGGGVYLIDTTLRLISQTAPKKMFGPRNYKFRIASRGDRVWISQGKALFEFQGRQFIKEIPLCFSINDMSQFQLVQYKNYIYYTSESGLISLDINDPSYHQKEVLPGLGEANQLTVIDNQLWLVSLQKGIFQLESKSEGDLIIKRTMLSNRSPSNLIKDHEGNLWVASYGNGLFFLPINAENFEIIDFPNYNPDVNLESVLIDGDKTLVGDQTGNLWCLEKELHKHNLIVSKPKPFNRILEIRKLPSSAYLLGTDHGLFRWTSEDITSIHPFPIKNIFVHKDGKVLINTFKGSFLSNITTLDSTNSVFHLRDYESEKFTRIFKERSYSSLIDSKGQIWLGNSWSGLTVMLNDSITFLKNLAPVFNSVVVDLLELDNGIICAATQGDGLAFICGNDYFLINESNGLSGNICNDLLAKGNNIWVATNKGISYIKNVNFGEKSFEISKYNKADGLLSSQIDAIDLQDSILYLATAKGLMTVNTVNLAKNEIPPRIYITGVNINESSQALKMGYNLSHDEKNIRIRFVGLSYKSRGKVLYRYKMDGVDEDWIRTTALETNYSNLPPGKYLFMVTAIGQRGEPSSDMRQIRFHIHPHFSQTGLFRFTLVNLALIVLYFLYNYIYNFQQRSKLERLVAEKTLTLKEKFKDLEEMNSKLELSNRELQQFAHVASHDLKAPLRNVAGFIQLLGRRAKSKLNEKEQEYIQFAVNGVKKMNLIIDDLLSLSKIDKLEQEKDSVCFKEVLNEVIEGLKFQISEKKANLRIYGEFPTLYFNRTNARQLWQNLIANALTYQDKDLPEIQITCRSEKEKWVFGVKDNGIGIAPQYKEKIFEIFQRLHGQNEYVGTGVGLAICKKIVEKNRGKIWCESEEGQGATFFFTLPKD